MSSIGFGSLHVDPRFHWQRSSRSEGTSLGTSLGEARHKQTHTPLLTRICLTEKAVDTFVETDTNSHYTATKVSTQDRKIRS